MDYVFIDTSIFIEENYFAPLNRIHTLSEFCSKGLISIVMPKITEGEIRKHLKSDIKKAYGAFKKECKALRNLKGLDDICRLGRDSFHVDNAMLEFNKFMEKGSVLTLDYDKCCDVEKVFNGYFDVKTPFSEGKKHEFPDAFVLVGLENLASELKKEIIVLSSDLDFKKYESPYLVKKDYKKFIDNLFDEIKRNSVYDCIESKIKDIEQEVESVSIGILEDSMSYSFIDTNSIVDEVEVEEFEVEINSENYSIVRDSDSELLIELICSVKYSVNLNYENYDTASYDREDGVWYNVERGDFNLSEESDVIVNIEMIKDKDSDEYVLNRIIDINIDELMDSINKMSF